MSTHSRVSSFTKTQLFPTFRLVSILLETEVAVNLGESLANQSRDVIIAAEGSFKLL